MIGWYKTATCSTLSINSLNVLPVSSDSLQFASFWGWVRGHGVLHKTFSWTRSHGHKGRGDLVFSEQICCLDVFWVIQHVFVFNRWFWYLCVCSCWQDVAFFIISSQEADLCIHLHVNLRSCSLIVSLSLISWFKISTIQKHGQKKDPTLTWYSLQVVLSFCAKVAVKRSHCAAISFQPRLQWVYKLIFNPLVWQISSSMEVDHQNGGCRKKVFAASYGLKDWHLNLMIRLPFTTTST